jgi:4-amino-4-deoxy-L-arabinose transferase-like glycosyltransferase
MNRKFGVLHYIALIGVLTVALFFRLYNIGAERYGNLYYASTVYSMLTSWSNFFFASFDPAGYVTVDKPPLGFWVQSISAMIFGFEGWALMLPQILSGVLACLVLYWLVRRTYGPTAGLLAALILAVTPIAVAADRNNTMDAQLILVLLLSACALVLAVEKNSLKWLLAGAALVGVGFNIKMLQAYMMLPAFYGFYFLAARTTWLRKIGHLALASLVLAIVSFAWVIAVDLTPADQRPYVGSSTDNTVSELIVGHNGVTRLGSIVTWFGMEAPQRGPGNRQFPPDGPNPPNRRGQNPPAGPNPADPNGPLPQAQFPPAPGQGQNLPPLPPDCNVTPTPGTNNANVIPMCGPGQLAQGNFPPQVGGPAGGGIGPAETGQVGITRLFSQQLAGQVTWLLPLALVFMLVLPFRQKLSWPLNDDAKFVLFWGLWLVPMAIFFSFAGLFHRYYLEMLAPAVAAFVAGGLVILTKNFVEKRLVGWLLPVAILASATFEAILLRTYWPGWNSWLAPVTLTFGALAAAGLVFSRLVPNLPSILTRVSVGVAFIGLLAAPVIWATTPLIHGGDVALPYAGPELSQRGGGSDLTAYASLAEYLSANAGDESFIVAGPNANIVAPIILLTGQPAMAIGGFSGSDPILSTERFAAYVKDGTVRYVIVPGDERGGQGINQWVQNSCQLVPDIAWKSQTASPNPSQGGVEHLTLYDCQ